MEILNSQPIMEVSIWLIIAIIILILFVVGCLTVFTLSSTTKTANITCGMSIAGAFLILICVLMGMFGVADVPSDKNRIEVMISDKVDLEDFYEKYEIVEKRGNIWVLDEKYPQEEK